MKTSHFFNCILFVLIIVIGCDKENKITNNNISFTGIAKTTPLGTIIEDDFVDWQPRCIGQESPPLCVHPAYPNPAGKDSTELSLDDTPILGCWINFRILEFAHIKIIIKDRPDNFVCTLVDTMNSAGFHSILWELKDGSGELLPNGIYRVYMTSTIDDLTYQSYGDIGIEWDTEY